ncbi:hypothetical protein C0J52_00411 [Blattella germanica]|nr:hypothetical protein C0J52_00411 [Blattella germanica]
MYLYVSQTVRATGSRCQNINFSNSIQSIAIKRFESIYRKKQTRKECACNLFIESNITEASQYHFKAAISRRITFCLLKEKSDVKIYNALTIYSNSYCRLSFICLYLNFT